VARAGGLPVEFPSLALGEQVMKPTAMLFRNLAAIEVEELIRANSLDAVVLLAGCDKTVPAQLMDAISAGVPALMITGGPCLAGCLQGEPIASGSDLSRLLKHSGSRPWAPLEERGGRSLVRAPGSR
jgi:dihydroxyacid dehydratase/phosphogluconate dehydratase